MLESQPNKKNWCSSVKDLLCQLGFHYVWFFQDIGNSNIFLKLVKQRIRDNFIQGWNGRINNSSRASLYKHLLSFEFKPYLDSVKINKFRTAFARLRVSSHRLRIETGRWSKPTAIPVNERLCSECHTLDDEFHFVCECSLFRDLRIKYLPIHYRQRPNMYKFIELMCTDNEILLRNLCTFLYKAFELKRIFDLRN